MTNRRIPATFGHTHRPNGHTLMSTIQNTPAPPTSPAAPAVRLVEVPKRWISPRERLNSPGYVTNGTPFKTY